MVEPVTTTTLAIAGLGWIAGTVAGGAIGNAADRTLFNYLRELKNRIAGLRSLPENEDIARAIRIAQIQALERSIGDYRAIGRSEWIAEPYTRPDHFFAKSNEFCRLTIGRCLNPTVKLNVEVTEPLNSAIDAILTEPIHDGPAGRRGQALASFAEGAVLDELVDVLDGIILPEGFEEHFRKGTNGKPMFLDLFGAYIAEQIKSNARFRAVFVAGQLSRIEGLAFDSSEFLARIEEQFGSVLERIAKGTEKISGHVAAVDERTHRIETNTKSH